MRRMRARLAQGFTSPTLASPGCPGQMPVKKRGPNQAGLAQRSVNDFFNKPQPPDAPTECSGKVGKVSPAGRNGDTPTEHLELKQVLVSAAMGTAKVDVDEGKAKIDPVPKGHALEGGAERAEVMGDTQCETVATDQARERSLVAATPEGACAVPKDAQHQPRPLARNASAQSDLVSSLPDATDGPDDLSEALAADFASELATALEEDDTDDPGGVLPVGRADDPKGLASGSAEARCLKGGGLPEDPVAHPPGDGPGHPAQDEPAEHGGGVAVADQDPGPPRGPHPYAPRPLIMAAVVPDKPSVRQRRCPVRPLGCTGWCGKPAHKRGPVVTHTACALSVVPSCTTSKHSFNVHILLHTYRAACDVRLMDMDTPTSPHVGRGAHAAIARGTGHWTASAPFTRWASAS